MMITMSSYLVKNLKVRQSVQPPKGKKIVHNLIIKSDVTNITNLSDIFLIPIYFLIFSDIKKGIDVLNFNKNDTSDQEIIKPFKSIGAFSSKSPSVARQSWGTNTDIKGISGGDGDKIYSPKGRAEEDDEDEDAQSLSDDDNDRKTDQRSTSSGTRIGKLSMKHEDEEEEEVRNEHFRMIILITELHPNSISYLFIILKQHYQLFNHWISGTQKQQQQQ